MQAGGRGRGRALSHLSSSVFFYLFPVFLVFLLRPLHSASSLPIIAAASRPSRSVPLSRPPPSAAAVRPSTSGATNAAINCISFVRRFNSATFRVQTKKGEGRKMREEGRRQGKERGVEERRGEDDCERRDRLPDRTETKINVLPRSPAIEHRSGADSLIPQGRRLLFSWSSVCLFTFHLLTFAPSSAAQTMKWYSVIVLLTWAIVQSRFGVTIPPSFGRFPPLSRHFAIVSFLLHLLPRPHLGSRRPWADSLTNSTYIVVATSLLRTPSRHPRRAGLLACV